MPALADLENFGRKLAAAQGYAGADVDFIAYGAAAQQALRKRGGAVPALDAYRVDSRVAAEPARQVVDAVRAKIITPDEARAWFGVALPHRRRVFSRAWFLRVGLGAAWRIALFGAMMALGASRFAPSLAQLGVLATVLIGPGIFWKPWRTVWRWTAASIAVAYVLAPTPLFADGVVVVLASSLPAGVLAARGWSLRG